MSSTHGGLLRTVVGYVPEPTAELTILAVPPFQRVARLAHVVGQLAQALELEGPTQAYRHC